MTSATAGLPGRRASRSVVVMVDLISMEYGLSFGPFFLLLTPWHKLHGNVRQESVVIIIIIIITVVVWFIFC